MGNERADRFLRGIHFYASGIGYTLCRVSPTGKASRQLSDSLFERETHPGGLAVDGVSVTGCQSQYALRETEAVVCISTPRDFMGHWGNFRLTYAVFCQVTCIFTNPPLLGPLLPRRASGAQASSIRGYRTLSIKVHWMCSE